MAKSSSTRFFLAKPAYSDTALGLVVLLLFAVQVLMTLAFLERLPLEDFAESVRSPYWWLNNTVFNGISSSITYYVLHVTAFNVFGFSIYMAKWLRLGLHLLSLISTAVLLRQWMGARLALVPLIIVGLSPTWLFFNTNQAQFGIDLQYAPIILLLAMNFPLQKKWLTYFYSALLGTVFIWSSLTYPTGLFLFPSFAMVVLWRWWMLPGPRNWPLLFKLGLAALCGMAIPIVACLLYVKDPQLLIYDSYFKSGIFRGGGGGFTRRPAAILEHYRIVLVDFFVRPNSYSFGIPNVEFNNWFGWFGFAAVLAGSCKFAGHFLWQLGFKGAWKSREGALLLWMLAGILFIFNFPQLIATFPGIRRVTGVLVLYYGLVAYVWWAIWKWPKEKIALWGRIALGAGVLAHLAGHLITLPTTLRVAGVVSRPSSGAWVREKATLAESLEHWEHFTREGNPLDCRTVDTLENCRYAEIFGAIRAYRHWTKKEPSPIYAWDPVTKKVIPLELGIWERHERAF